MDEMKECMDDYIRLEDAINAIRENGIYGSGYSDSEREEDVIDMLMSLPRYQVEVKDDV